MTLMSNCIVLYARKFSPPGRLVRRQHGNLWLVLPKTTFKNYKCAATLMTSLLLQ